MARVSAFVGCADRGSHETPGLVLDRGGYLLQFVGVLAGVVGAEEELATSGKLDADIGLGAATVAAVKRGQLHGWCDCCGHVDLFPVRRRTRLDCSNIQPGVHIPGRSLRVWCDAPTYH